METMWNKFAFKIKKENKRFFKLLWLDNTCKWKLRANRLDSSDSFRITIHNHVHIYSSMYKFENIHHINKHIIVEKIHDKFKDIPHIVKPQDIITDIRNEFRIALSYSTV